MNLKNLKSVSELVFEAYKEKYAVPMIDVMNLEFVKAVIDIAYEEKSPIIIAFTPFSLAKEEDIVKTSVKYAFNYCKVPFAVHLDHGRNFFDIAKAISLGFTGVMIDASHLKFDDNITVTKKVVEIAQLFNVSVEGEVGRIRGEEVGIEEAGELDVEELTNPDGAKKFVEATKVDVLSVSVGTVHGMRFRDKVRVDVPLVKKISDATQIPLALHGSFRAPDNMIRQAIENGICKINLALHFWEPFMEGTKEALQLRQEIIPPEIIIGKGMDYVKEEIRYRIKIAGSSNKV